MPLCYIAFGSNLGDKIGSIARALELMKEHGTIKRVSQIYLSQPWGKGDQPEFLNGVLEYETGLDPIRLLEMLKRTEKSCGRKPRERWGPREIDLDILLYENYVVMLSFLHIPHLHLLERDFFLFPLLEINPTLRHPIHHTPLTEFAHRLKNRLKPFACLLPL
ncbi:MAG: 2-amino-4-hydroxy-6-hydroxymethyldihydropteridine diphosphokinase [Aquificaceae bacterium]|nr:2-amino-4-hydroxy-6-hydroxymethyldihydropteridine diphosphokinase [Aquificaceae bacterium]